MSRKSMSAIEPIDEESREFVQGLERGFAVVLAFSDAASPLTIAQVAERTALTRAVARRYLLTLESLGYVIRTGDQFALTPRLLNLGFTYLSTLDVTGVVQPFMEKLASALRESCSVAVLDHREIVYVARVPAKRIMSINLVVGSRLPAHTTALGKILLAYAPAAELVRYFEAGPLPRFTRRTITDPATLRRQLEEARARGFAVANEETEDGVRTIAVPIVNRQGEVNAAINVSGHASRVTVAQLQTDYLPPLREAAQGISEALGADLSAWAETFGPGRRRAVKR